MAGKESVNGARANPVEKVSALLDRINKHVVTPERVQEEVQGRGSRGAGTNADGVEERVIRTKNVLRPAAPLQDEQNQLNDQDLLPVPERLVAPVAHRLGLDRQNVALYLSLRSSGLTTFKAAKKAGLKLMDGKQIDQEVARRQEESYNIPDQDELADTLAMLEPGDLSGLVTRLELALRVVEYCQRTPLAVKTYARALEALAEGLVSAGESVLMPDNSEMITAAVAAVSENEDALLAAQRKEEREKQQALADPPRAAHSVKPELAEHEAAERTKPARSVQRHIRAALRAIGQDQDLAGLLTQNEAPTPSNIHLALQLMLDASFPALQKSGQLTDRALAWEELLVTSTLDDDQEVREYIAHLPFTVVHPRGDENETELRLTAMFLLDEEDGAPCYEVLLAVGSASTPPIVHEQSYMTDELSSWAMSASSVMVVDAMELSELANNFISHLLDEDFGLDFFDEEDDADTDEEQGDADAAEADEE